MLTYLTNQPPCFVFLVHPRDVHDLLTSEGGSIVAQYSASEQEFCDTMCSFPPAVIGDVTFGFSPFRGEVLALPRMPAQLLRDPGCIAEGVALAAKRGTSVIGLGGLTATATRGGATLVDGLPKGVTLTTGNALTAAIARHNVIEAGDALGLGSGATVAVVGCTGSVGVAASRLLADAGFGLVLIGRTVARVHRELGALARSSLVSADQRDIAKADVVLLLTSDSTARLTPDVPRPGSVVIDFAHPVNVETARYGEFLQREVRVVQGGLVLIPGYQCTADLNLPDRRSTLACLAETYLFARESIREHSVGLATVELAAYLERVAARHGVRPRPLGLDAPLSAATA